MMFLCANEVVQHKRARQLTNEALAVRRFCAGTAKGADAEVDARGGITARQLAAFDALLPQQVLKNSKCCGR
jgi:hypothetical protein